MGWNPGSGTRPKDGTLRAIGKMSPLGAKDSAATEGERGIGGRVWYARGGR